MNETIFVILWVVLGLATLTLAVYRWAVAKGEKDIVHLRDAEQAEIPQQVALARKLDGVDRWGKALTVLTVVVGLGLAGMYLYRAWEDPGAVPNTFYRR